MKIDITQFSTEHPKTPGQYFWNSGSNTNPDVKLITVHAYPSKIQYGMSWDEYLGVPEYGGRNVGHLVGTFLKIEFK